MKVEILLHFYEILGKITVGYPVIFFKALIYMLSKQCEYWPVTTHKICICEHP